MTTASPLHQEMSDWDFCQESLAEVSRTFTQPIQFLPETQKRALAIGYLLCRVADTVEDCVGISDESRDALFSDFQRVLRGQLEAESLSRSFEGAAASEPELKLMRNLDRVMNVFSSQSARTKETTIRWVSEMADGMRLYSRRSEATNFVAMISMNDLERYCYFVAGTVGHMITELFDDAIGQPGLEARLRENAESFGLGLQLVNIVKDITDDAERGVCYIPRQVCRSEGIEPEELLRIDCRPAAKRVVSKVIFRAEEHLQHAFEYTLSIPPTFPQLRLFCLLPLWMALETLHLARDNDEVFEPGKKVKISRETVARIIADCGRDCQDDRALQASYARLKARSTVNIAAVS